MNAQSARMRSVISKTYCVATGASGHAARYLDNEHNAVGKINENYARELLELHTMGVGSGYTQTDVQELARVLTGIGMRWRS